jgi:hypothetical protein
MYKRFSDSSVKKEGVRKKAGPFSSCGMVKYLFSPHPNRFLDR